MILVLFVKGSIDDINPRTWWNIQPQDHDWREQDKIRVHVPFQEQKVLHHG